MNKTIPYRYYKKARLNQKNLSAAIGVSKRTVLRYVNEGMPYHGKNRNKYFLLTEVMEWMQNQPKLFELWVEIKMKLDQDD